MKEKVLKLITVIALIIVLTSINVVFLGYHIVVALADELETQGNNTNIADVKFDAYFKGDNGNTHYRQANISDEQVYLYLNINVLEKGSVDNAKIRINDSNFKIKDSSNSSEYVKNINLDTNEIELNSIIYNNNVEIEIPIEFNKVDNINADYFSKETNITIEGTYKEEEDEEALQGDIVTRLEWTDNAEVNMSQSIEKCIDLGENGVLIQQQIATTVENGNLPREVEQFAVTVPRIGDILPTNIDVLASGTKLNDSNVQYNEETGILNITKPTVVNGEGNVSWDSDLEEYTVIYMYDQSVKENSPNITLHTEMNSKLFTKGNSVKTDEQQITLAFHGNVVSSEKTATQELYKGYLYANSANETTYKENNVIEISNAEIIDSIKASTSNSYFVDSNQIMYDANSITLYKETLINKNRFITLFGENGYINVKDVNGNIIYTVNNQSETDESGNIHITYGQAVTGIVFETSKPVEEGQFTIHNVKAIQGNTGYSKNELKTFTRLNTNEVVETNLGVDTVETGINLLDTTTEAKLEISNTNLSTLQMNENVQLSVTLKTSSPKYDLFKNPMIELVLPSSISNIYVNSVNKVYADDFAIEYARLVEGANGEKVVQVALSGEQKDYSKEINELAVVVNANVEFNVLTPSQKSSVIMNYTNENGNQGSYQTSVDVNIQSKPGMMIYNNLSGFNAAGDSIYTIDDNMPVGVLDLEGPSMTAKVNTAVINNYDIDVKDAVVIGRIPKKGVYDGTIDTTLVEGIRTNLSGVEILYSANAEATQDDNSWSTDYTNAASYMIRLDNMAAGQAIAIQYEVTIPEMVGYGQSIYAQTNATYNYLGNANTQTSTIGAKSENVITNNILALANTVQIDQEGLGIAISAVSGGSELEEGTPIYEGQMITYTMQVTNNTGADLHNVSAKAIQNNGHLYDLIEEETYDPNAGEDSRKTYHRYDELDTNEKTFDTIDTLVNGESTILQYTIVASETEDASAQTNGSISIQADELNETTVNTISNPIQQAEIKAIIENSLYEEEKIYTGKNMHMNLIIENISGNSLDNIKARIQLPDGIYMNSADTLILDTVVIGGEDVNITEDKIINRSYDQENRVLTFEIPRMEAEEITTLELYVEIDSFNGPEKDCSFMYQLETQNIYVSNMATVKITNTQRNINAEQTANIDETAGIKDEDVFDITTRVENNEAQDLYFKFSDSLPEGFTVQSGKVISQGTEMEIPIVDQLGDETDEFKIFNNILTGGMNIPAGSSVEIVITIEVDIEYITQDTITNTMDVTYGELNTESDTYQFAWYNSLQCSKDYQIKLSSGDENQGGIEVIQIGNPENNSVLTNGQEITYTFEIKNTRNYEVVTTIYDYIPKGIVAESITLDGQTLENGDIYVEGYRMPANSTSILEIKAYADIGGLANTELVNNLTVSTLAGDVTSNDIIYKVVVEEPEEPDPEEPENPDPEDPDPENPGTEDPDPEDPDPENPDPEDPDPEDPDPENPDPEDPDPEDPDPENPDPENPDPENPDPEDPDPEDPDPENPEENKQYTISGIAWVDANRDGKRDSSEITLSGVGIRVLDADKGTYVNNINATTSEDGQYQIIVGKGNYILVFSYNTERYNLTEYRKEGVSEDQNSDVINRNLTIDGTSGIVGATDIINVNSENVSNIDIGLTEASTFDLELDKYVSEIVVQTNKSTTQYGYNNQSLVKVEIPSKELNNATVIIRYTIRITNTGELPGYVQNIVDYMPSDLTFSSELNSDWYQVSANLQNNSLSNTAIAPGETKTVDLVLVKTMNNNNTGTVINMAEIGDASNALDLSDTDSTPGNNNASEDDYGRAEVIISVGTGKAIIFISIIFTILALTGVSVFFINKKVLKKDEIDF